MGLQRYKEILQKPEKHLLKTAKDMLRCFFRQLYISAYARTPCLTPGCQTYQDPGVGHIPYANPVNSLRKGKAFLLKEAKTSGQIPAKDKRQNKKQTK
ncbi:hypothetical protein DWV41_07660 [Bacteroides stercoris]|uniref:Uncharacterized protein n=1 Tax=Bacteroides stercoris TaxID=46506 RepID=A0A413E2L1_BACSE|nr:hypothetical protein DWV41_07660 [Bacteroides stercoris]